MILLLAKLAYRIQRFVYLNIYNIKTCVVTVVNTVNTVGPNISSFLYLEYHINLIQWL